MSEEIKSIAKGYELTQETFNGYLHSRVRMDEFQP